MSFSVYDAILLAEEAHRGQKRTWLDEPYVRHPIRVANDVHRYCPTGIDTLEQLEIAAVLHDVPEDTSITLTGLKAREVPTEALRFVHLLTKWWDRTCPPELVRANKVRYYADILADERVTRLKVIDRLDNLRDLSRVLSSGIEVGIEIPGPGDPEEPTKAPPFEIPGVISKRLAIINWATAYADKTREEIKPLLESIGIDTPAARLKSHFYEMQQTITQQLRRLK